MRRRSLTSTLARVALAYVLALQTLLGVWAGHAAASTPNAGDPSLTLCGTAAGGETQNSDRDAILPSHCAVMCLSGACADGNPLALTGTAVEFLPPQTRAIALPAAAAAVGGVLHVGVSARGP